MKNMSQKNQVIDMPTPKSPKRSILIASAFALAFSLLAVPLISEPADASLDDGGFCIQAASSDGVKSKVFGPPTCSASVPGDSEQLPTPPAEALRPVSVRCENEKVFGVRFHWDSIPHAEYLVEVVDSKGESYEVLTHSPYYTYTKPSQSHAPSQDMLLSVRYVIDGKESPRSDSYVFKIVWDFLQGSYATCV